MPLLCLNGTSCMSRLRTSCLAAPACLGLAAAQSIAPDEMHARTAPYVPPSLLTLRTEAKLVEVPVVVRDGLWRAVAGFTRDDFEIYDEGKKQTIAGFSVESFSRPAAANGSGAEPAEPASTAEAKPAARLRFVTLCFDDLNTPALTLKAAKDAAQRFVKTSLAPGDLVTVTTTAQTRDTKFTADVTVLTGQIAKVTAHQRFTGDEWLDGCPPISPYEAYLIVNNLDRDLLQAKISACSVCRRTPCAESAVTGPSRGIWESALRNSRNTLRVVESLVDGMEKLPGQRVLLLSSAGFLTGNLETELEKLTAKALHAEVVINTLDARRLFAMSPEPGPLGQRLELRMSQAAADAMAEMASGTGGAFYHNSNDLDRGFQDLGTAPSTVYVLSFAPSLLAADGRYHHLKVQFARGDGYSVQARQGYTAASPNAASPAPAPSRLDREAMASDTVTELPVEFTWEPKAAPPGVTMVAHLDVSRLHFETAQDRRRQKLTIIGALLDDRGNFVTGKRSELDLNLTEATFTELAESGFTGSMNLDAPPGHYSVRGLAQDSLDGKLAAAGGAIEIK